jgi:hypothetical protein
VAVEIVVSDAHSHAGHFPAIGAQRNAAHQCFFSPFSVKEMLRRIAVSPLGTSVVSIRSRIAPLLLRRL